MGYCMEQRGASFTIEAENMAGAIAAVKALDGAEADKGASGFSHQAGVTIPHYAWVNRGFGRHNSLEKLMEEWRWELEVERDDDGNETSVVGIMFDGEKLGDDLSLLAALAPFVEPGSYIEMSGEDSYIWRYYFDGQTVDEQEGTVTFE